MDSSKSILKNKEAVSRETHINKNATIIENDEADEDKPPNLDPETSKPLQEFNKVKQIINKKNNK